MPEEPVAREFAETAPAPGHFDDEGPARAETGPVGDFGTGIDEEERAPDFDRADPPYDDIPADRDVGDAGRDFGGEESQFEYAPPFRPRRNWVRLGTWAAALFAVLALGAVAAVNFLGVPDWLPVQRPLFAVAEPDLKLEFPVEEQERRTLANGTEFFGARIVVTNEARASRDVPPILIVLRDARERIVYSWEVVPPQGSLAPGETMTINEAITDVPRAAVFADIGWAPR